MLPQASTGATSPEKKNKHFEHSPPHPITRNFGLDLIRATAIMLVVLGHGRFLLDGSKLQGFPFTHFIDGVDLFFTLSGFLIGSILLQEINTGSPFGSRQLLSFWKRRWLRTLPNYYLILALNFVAVSCGINHYDVTQFNWKFIVFCQNFAHPFVGFFYESWSLSIEEWFYIFSPILLICFLQFASPKSSFIAVTVVMIVVPFICRLCLLDPYITDFSFDQTFRKLVITRLDSIAFGLLAAWLYCYYKEYWLKFRLIGFATSIALFIFILQYRQPDSSFYKQTIYFSLNPLACMLLIPFTHSLSFPSNSFSRIVTHISKISYSMYLINLSLVANVIGDNFPATSPKNAVLQYVLYWIIVLVGSSLLYKYFEKPFMNLRS
jgi:peptidoglycan/LPS O-acetylase OafA/YrhL